MEIILGVLISGIVQYVKNKFGTTSMGTLAILAGISLFGAAMYTWLATTGYWDAVYNIIVTAGAFYTFIIARFESTVPSIKE